MRLFACVPFLLAAWGCGSGTGVGPAEAGTSLPSDAASGVVDGTEPDASPSVDGPARASDAASVPEAFDGAPIPDGTSGGDPEAPCTMGSASAQVNGAAVSFTDCTAYEVGATSGFYEYLEIECASPGLWIQWTPSTGTKSFQYMPAGSTAVYTGSASVTIATLGSVGGFVEGRATAPQLQTQGETGAAMALQCSFHACRQPDVADIGH